MKGTNRWNNFKGGGTKGNKNIIRSGNLLA
jgi:hypothetical protein